MRTIIEVTACFCVLMGMAAGAAVSPNDSAGSWRSLPLIENGRVDQDWVQIGWGGFTVDEGALRTEPDEKGMGLLLYKKEKFGNCRIRIVYKSKEAKSNSGVFIRIDDGIVGEAEAKLAAVRRDADGGLSPEELEKMKDASKAEQGPWYAVHHGYEVQICDQADAFHRTGAIYSLASAASVAEREPGVWRTMVITLEGNLVRVDLDGKRVSTFDPSSRDLPRRKEWHEPSREAKRPEMGYIGLQTHDPGDVVFFKEISVRPIDPMP